MPSQAIPQVRPDSVEPEAVDYIVVSDRLQYGSAGEMVSLVPTGAVLALVEGGHLAPIPDRPKAAVKKEK